MGCCMVCMGANLVSPWLLLVMERPRLTQILKVAESDAGRLPVLLCGMILADGCPMQVGGLNNVRAGRECPRHLTAIHLGPGQRCTACFSLQVHVGSCSCSSQSGFRTSATHSLAT